MRAVVQRVQRASVAIDGQVVGAIGSGLLVFLGVGDADTAEEARRLWTKIFKLRIFPDAAAGKPTGAALADTGGGVLIVSQFTLYADCRKGNRPSFAAAGAPDESRRLHDLFVDCARADAAQVACGRFGADMQVELVNDGPFTICLDTDDLARPRRA